jgi:hypothetical protein
MRILAGQNVPADRRSFWGVQKRQRLEGARRRNECLPKADIGFIRNSPELGLGGVQLRLKLLWTALTDSEMSAVVYSLLHQKKKKRKKTRQKRHGLGAP